MRALNDARTTHISKSKAEHSWKYLPFPANCFQMNLSQLTAKQVEILILKDEKMRKTFAEKRKILIIPTLQTKSFLYRNEWYANHLKLWIMICKSW